MGKSRKPPNCSECLAGETTERASHLVSHPNPDHPNLRTKKWVCPDHYLMLLLDYGDADLRILTKAKANNA
jgi:hypothetical protein